MFTPKEQQWPAAHPSIPFTVDPAWHQLNFLAAPGGISSDCLRRMEQMLPVRFKPILSEFWNPIRQRSKGDQVLLLSALIETSNQQKDFLFTEPCLSMPIAIFSAVDIAYFGWPEKHPIIYHLSTVVPR